MEKELLVFKGEKDSDLWDKILPHRFKGNLCLVCKKRFADLAVCPHSYVYVSAIDLLLSTGVNKDKIHLYTEEFLLDLAKARMRGK